MSSSKFLIRDSRLSPRQRRRLRFQALESRRLLANLFVNSLDDNTTAGDNLVTLREAIEAANTDSTTDLGETGSGADVIQFTGSAATGIVALTAGELSITAPLTLMGSGITIDGTGNSRIMDVTATAGDVTVQGMTLTGGQVTGNGAGINFRSTGSLTIQDSVVTGNAASGNGGGIYIRTGDATIVDSTISGNSPAGILAEDGVLTVNGTTITGNGDDGIRLSGGELNVADSAIDANGGNGIVVTGRATVTRSSISSNGHHGIRDRDSASLAVTHSTIARNSIGISLFVHNYAAVTNTTISSNIVGAHLDGAYLDLGFSTVTGNEEGITTYAYPIGRGTYPSFVHVRS
jgi:hypothetical protein